jgi:lipopolysaccharide transport system ATP-binding protein
MSSSDIAISIRGLSKAYTIAHEQEKHSTLAEMLLHKARNLKSVFRSASETFWALKDIDLDIHKGDVVGIIGRNGAGKSTLLKILSRITEPTSGQIDLYGRVGSLLEVGTGFHPELTGRENVYLNGAILGMSRAEIRKQFDEIVDFAGIATFLDTPVKRYSSGMYVRLAFAVAAHLEPEILIVDEVLAVGDLEFQKKCLGKMKDVSSHGRTVLFVSHNMAAVKALCDRAIFLAAGRVEEDGPVDDTLQRYMATGATGDFVPAAGPLKHVSVRQDSGSILVEAQWAHHARLALPSLGFVIHDYLGSPVVGSNPVLSGVSPSSERTSSGRISARLTEPRLLDGSYHLSVWFGDGKEDFVEFPMCMKLDVQGMAGPRQLPISTVGSVEPTCKFEFSS